MTREEFFETYEGKDIEGILARDFKENTLETNPFNLPFHRSRLCFNFFERIVGDYDVFWKEHEREINSLFDKVFGNMSTGEILNNYGIGDEDGVEIGSELIKGCINVALLETTKELYWDYQREVLAPLKEQETERPLEYHERLGKGNDSREYYFPNMMRALKEKEIKISDLAKALNKDYYQVSRKINGIGQFNMTDIKKICNFLGGSFEDLFYTPYKQIKSYSTKKRDEEEPSNIER